MGRSTVVGIDVGGTTIKGLRLDGHGVIERRASRTTPVHSGSAAVVAAIVSVAGELVDASVAAIGVVTPGVIDSGAGTVRYATNLSLHDTAVVAPLVAAFGLPTVLGHDVAAAAEAEAAARGAEDVLFVALGTGMAAAHVVDGVARRGANGLAGELGHAPVDPLGLAEPCACGGVGCPEAYASGSAIARRYLALGGSDPLDAGSIVLRLATDPVAARVWADAVEALSAAVATACCLLDPGLVVLGGGVSLAGADLLDPVQARVAALLPWRSAPAVELSTLGTDAGQRGAVRLANQAEMTVREERFA
jgi:glucokinase